MEGLSFERATPRPYQLHDRGDARTEPPSNPVRGLPTRAARLRVDLGVKYLQLMCPLTTYAASTRGQGQGRRQPETSSVANRAQTSTAKPPSGWTSTTALKARPTVHTGRCRTNRWVATPNWHPSPQGSARRCRSLPYTGGKPKRVSDTARGSAARCRVLGYANAHPPPRPPADSPNDGPAVVDEGPPGPAHGAARPKKQGRCPARPRRRLDHPPPPSRRSSSRLVPHTGCR